jgi:hypothetical protein
VGFPHEEPEERKEEAVGNHKWWKTTGPSKKCGA